MNHIPRPQNKAHLSTVHISSCFSGTAFQDDKEMPGNRRAWALIGVDDVLEQKRMELTTLADLFDESSCETPLTLDPRTPGTPWPADSL